MLVQTAKGLIEMEKLVVNQSLTTEDNAMVTVTEWYLGDELVRRDVHVNILRSVPVFSEQGEV